MAESERPSNVEVESLVEDMPLFLGEINQKLTVIKGLQNYAPAHVCLSFLQAYHQRVPKSGQPSNPRYQNLGRPTTNGSVRLKPPMNQSLIYFYRTKIWYLPGSNHPAIRLKGIHIKTNLEPGNENGMTEYP